MPVCGVCLKWQLLGDKCPVCTSQERLSTAIASDWLPASLEAEAKVTKILDSAFYSVARLVPEEESPRKGVSTPKRAAGEGGAKGEKSPKRAERATASTDEKEEKSIKVGEENKSPYLKPKEEKDRGVSTTPKKTEDRKPLPRRREEEKETVKRSRTPKRRQEKEKKKRKRGGSRSGEVSGSEVRRQKREAADSQKEKNERVEEEAEKESTIEREAYLRPRPTQRRPRSPHTPERPPPGRSSSSKGGGQGKPQGSGWRGRIPYSSHPRWTQGTNKGITKRAKQELQERKTHGRGGRYRW